MFDPATMSHDELLEYMRTYSCHESYKRGDKLQFKDIPKTIFSEDLCLAAMNGRYVYALRDIPKEFRTKEVCEAAIRAHRTRGNFSAMPKELLTWDFYKDSVSMCPYMFADAFTRSRKGREDQGYTLEDIDLCLEVLAPMRHAEEIYAGLSNPPELNTEQEKIAFAISKAITQDFTAIPRTLLYDALQLYRANMLGLEKGKTNVILCELNYKGDYERFALTEAEFKDVFSVFMNMDVPNQTGSSYTLRPMVHIWYRTATLGGPDWDAFFTDMQDGLPDSDIENGICAYIREDRMSALKSFLPAAAH